MLILTRRPEAIDDEGEATGTGNKIAEESISVRGIEDFMEVKKKRTEKGETCEVKP